MQKTAYTFAAFIALVLLPLAASAQSYPYYPYRSESLTADGSQTDYAYSQSTCVAAFSQQTGLRCHTGNVTFRLSSAPHTAVHVVSQCQVQGTSDVVPVLESCNALGFCPYGGSVSGTSCIAPACPVTQARDPQTGKCAPIKPNKALGPACVAGGASGPMVGNPCNAGTGLKFHEELIYSAGAPSALVERFFYNSRLKADTDAVVQNLYGRGWTSSMNYRYIQFLSTGVAVVWRPTGQFLDFAPPSSGNVYVPDADVADRLERLTDGSGNTTGWKLTVAADDSTELYSAVGWFVSVTDRAGSTVTLTRSTSSTPSSVAPGPDYPIFMTDQLGRSLGYVYNSQGRLTRMTDPAGGTYDFAYDSNDRLVSITFPDTKVRQFLYNESAHTGGTNLPHSLTGIIDDGVRFATYKYL